jgi:hypothetical protein
MALFQTHRASAFLPGDTGRSSPCAFLLRGVADLFQAFAAAPPKARAQRSP